MIKSTFINFYRDFLGTPHSSHYDGANRVKELIQRVLTDEQSLAMVHNITDAEIKETFMSLNPKKAPGPDGYNAGFFQKAWSIVGHEVTAAVKNFFRSGKLLKKANATVVALVPKIPNPSRVGDFRPISCCNTIYKCIAKILASRLQSALPFLIDPVQSGFVKGRRIADNIFLTQELMHGYHKSSSTPKCAMKVDIMKAYDNVRWDFLWDVLLGMNVHPTMVKWLQACVTTANYTLSINGENTGYFEGRRGLRQGDPLSSYLFVIVMEILTCILREKSLKSDFQFHWKCKQNKIINLCFADDLMIFCKGDFASVGHIHSSLFEFESLSGLKPSPHKSHIFFSGVDATTRRDILDVLGFSEGHLPVKYLGVPLLSTKLTHLNCKPMVDRITSKTKSWTNRDLTYAGRLQLIKNVLFSMQSYWSSLFILPKKVIKEVESVLRAFLWSGPDLKKSGAKVSWEHLCAPKDEGGLGLKSLQIWNKAAVSKHIWFIISGGEQSMWCQWVKSYLLKGKSFWQLKMPCSPTWTWRKLLNLRYVVHPFIKVIIGDGQSSSLWFDNWHPLGPLAERFGDRIIYDLGMPKDSKVSTIIRNSNWALPITQTWEINEIRDGLISLPVPSATVGDRIRWTLNTNGVFSVGSLWNKLRTPFPKVPWSYSVWFPGHIPKCSFITWVAIQERLYTDDRLVFFGTKSVSICSFCPSQESHDHLFFNCPYTSQVWEQMLGRINVHWPPRPWKNWIALLATNKGKSPKSILINLIFTTTLYHIWIERNVRKFQNCANPILVVVNKIHSVIRYRLMSLDKFSMGPQPNDLLAQWNIVPG